MPPLPVAEALVLCLERALPLGGEPVPLVDALGRTLAEDVRADTDVPGHDNAAMDGYAVRSADVAEASRDRTVTLRVVADVQAGQRFDGEIGPGEAVRIMTGAPIPRGADEVIERERAVESDERGIVGIRARRGAGKQIRRAGEDLRKGAVAIEAGERLGPAEIGLLASLGVLEPRCGRRPSVAILSTGDEVVPPDSVPKPGQVRDSNLSALVAAAIGTGAAPIPLGIAPDHPEVIAAALSRREAARADVIVTTAGISKSGERDFGAEVVRNLGYAQVFREVAMKPGRPLAVFEKAGRLLFALPGNPVAALVTFELFVRPVLLRMQGRRQLALPEAIVPAPMDKDERPGRVNFVRARIVPAPVPDAGPPGFAFRVAEVLPEGSGILRSMHVANALLRYEGTVRAGEPIRALLLKEVCP